MFWIINPNTFVITQSYSVDPTLFMVFDAKNYFWSLHLTSTSNMIQLDFSCFTDFSNYSPLTATADSFLIGDASCSFSYGSIGISAIPQ